MLVQTWFVKVRANFRLTVLFWRAMGIMLSATLGLLLGMAPGGLPVLSQSTTTAPSSIAAPAVEIALDLTIVSIDAEIDQVAQITEVSIRTIGTSLEEIVLQLPLIQFSAIERAIAQEIQLSPETIHQLIRYRLN